MTRTDETVIRAAVKMLRAGEATVGELAYFLNMNRQTVQYWADQAGIDVPERRFKYLERKWNGAGK